MTEMQPDNWLILYENLVVRFYKFCNTTFRIEACIESYHLSNTCRESLHFNGRQLPLLLQRRCVRASGKAMEKLCLFFRSGTKECVQGGIFIVYWDGLHQCNAVEIYICSLFPCEKGWKGDIQSSRLWREREKPHGQPQLFKLPGKRGTTLGHSYSSPAKPTEIHRVLLPIKSVGSW